MGMAAPPVAANSKHHEDGGTSSLAAAVVDGGGLQQQKTVELDAGALFVPKSKGSWAHCGYHLTTSIVAPPLLSLPFAFTLLGWGGGVVCLVVAAAVTFYNYNLLSLVLEHHAHLGNRLFRFFDMANLILGPKWARYYVGPIQFIVCYGCVVACILLGGQCMKVYLQPTNEVLESLFGDPKREQFSARNVVPRILSRSASVVLATTLAAMLPFFGDINAIIGAFGFIPLDFILPLVFYNLTFKPSKRSLVFWLNSAIAVVFATVGAIAAVTAVRQIGLDANTYRLFANV
ncbi:GABA transporter 1 [Linum perenne]